MRTEFGSWDMVAARWVLGLIPSQELPQIATEALEAGLDSPALRELAGELHPTLDASGPLGEEILDEIGVGIPDRSRAGFVLARAYAAQINDGTLSPYEGARQIWRIQIGVEGLMPELGPFVYWASEWDEADSAGRRRQCETAIRTAALGLADAP
jgi:hypothetical protein